MLDILGNVVHFRPITNDMVMETGLPCKRNVVFIGVFGDCGLIPRTTDGKFPDCGPNRRDAPRASAETLSGTLSADTFDVSLHADAFNASLQGTTRLYTTIR